MYREPSRFIESSLITETVETSPFPSLEIDKVDIAIKEIIKKNNIAGVQLVVKKGKTFKRMNYGLTSIRDSILVDRLFEPVIDSMKGVKSAMFIYSKDEVSVIILKNSQGFHLEDYLDNIAKLYIGN